MTLFRLVRPLARALASAIGVALLALLVSPAHAGVITNDTFWKDTSGNNIYSQGGGVFKFGNTYYWYGVKYAGAVAYAADPFGKKEDTTFQAVTCYSSTDLVNWKFENNIVTSSTPGLGGPTWFGRLGVFFNASTSRYVLVSQYFGGLGQGNIYFTGTSPTGNFSVNSLQYPVPGVANNTTGDQTVFTDTDGKSYLVCSSSSGRSGWYVAAFNANGIGTQTAVRIGGGTGREGNCMFKYNGRYYFCSSDLHGWNASQCYYISATNIFGPYGAEGIMTNSATDYCHVTQTGFFVTVAGTSGTTVIFAGDRWADFAGNGIGYNQWCPVTFSGTTPIFNSLSKWDLNAAAGTWTVAAGNNYAKNPSYEADRITLTTATGWTTTSNSGNSGGNGNGHTGDYFYHHTNSSTTRQSIAVPNGVYTLKVWHRSAGGQSLCRMFARNYGGSQLNTNLNTAVSSWAQRTISNINVTNGSIEIGIESTGAWVDFDDWELTGGGVVVPPTGDTYQAESGALAGGVTIDTNNGGFNGTGFANFPATGGTLTFNNVDGNGGGTKSLAIRYANGGAAARAGTITVNGAASGLSFAPTGGWSTWTTLNVNITLNNSTANTIQFASTGGDLGNIDELTVP
jgi:Glycosyl hydrolases family 43/Carbohydrate binding module (family 6)